MVDKSIRTTDKGPIGTVELASVHKDVLRDRPLVLIVYEIRRAGASVVLAYQLDVCVYPNELTAQGNDVQLVCLSRKTDRGKKSGC
jgi:hypothetical protein